MDVTMPLLTLRQINDIAADIYSFAERLSKKKESDDPEYLDHFANADELTDLCSELRGKILNLSFQLGELNRTTEVES